MRQNESKLQTACVNWFRMQYPKLSPVLFAVPNGGQRAKKIVRTRSGLLKKVSVEGKRLKEEGALSGVADLLLLYPNRENHCLAIEMKYGKNTQSTNQKNWQKGVTPLGVRYEVVNTFEKFQALISEYLQDTDFGKKN
ncbi:VRR-NUC domain-containing protein [Cruoricaptor ignavus]|uniref:VRR-NUC domain-containing protein n=1 Tax=Cruoricaptor ignavus TaxID=1118202 RepID=UPI00370D3A4B